ncbi:AraC family transcriptional regulator [Leptospira gomenensis]|uniref:AraC family transcriptional regulator n=1 Tax=Leptospira gomenensis TaxID=2484974 RepID=A0A5F1YC33_9LEPT|nr:helix-turn-helix domain-containing protein [Leptospira gomenensis]TGK34487.1 AraC family transcriptional regulator [Leptospira gomenensis]TGK40203.1 AraC family transcriptional regulator [Leptospira gomenensis]TGK41872.1 AraC family transcriptional regulator [Leptospira gomenensis]TGK55712.1 AraC family transcriptional regulator [Leptospira gomenensis]
MGFFPNLDISMYGTFATEVFNRYIEYFYAVSIAISFLTGISGLYKAKKDRLNLVRAIFLLSISFCLLGQGKALFYLTQGNGLLDEERRLFFSYFIGSAICACLTTAVYSSYLLGIIQDPLKLSLWGFLGFPILYCVSQFIDNLYTITYVGKSVVLLIQISAGITSFRYIRKNRMRPIYYNYPILNVTVCISILCHTIGLWIGFLPLVIGSAIVPAFLVVYFFILEYNHPEFWRKIENAELNNTESVLTELLLIEDGSSLSVEETEAGLSSYIPRNLIEGLDLSRIETKIEKFVEDREYLDEDLRLSDFAAYLGISLHQASYYLNNYKKSSFTDFLNFHRLEESKRMFLEKPAMNLLEIALASGFNSPSSFRRACIKFAGKSPKEFRSSLFKEKIAQEIETPISPVSYTGLELQTNR